MKLSIAILTYNHENYIEKALNSVLNQKIDYEYEIIVGDDFSNDKTREILLKFKEKYPEKIKLIFRSKNIGIASNVIDIFKKCTGEYIALLEGDDYWINDLKLKKQVEYLDKNKEYSGIAHQNIVINQEEKIINKPELFKKNIKFSLEKLEKEGLLYQTASLMFRNIFNYEEDKLNLIKEINEKIVDLTLAIILLTKGNIYILNEYMSVYRIDTTEKSSSSSAKASRNLKLFYNEYYEYLEKLEKVLLNNEFELYFLKSSILLGMIINSLKNKELKEIFIKIICKKEIKISKQVLISLGKLLLKHTLKKIKR